MTQAYKRFKMVTSHPRSQAEMIDEQINQLCADTGLIKKRLLEAVGLYQELYAGRMKFNGLRADEVVALQHWVNAKGKELEQVKLQGDPVKIINNLHEQFAIFKSKLVAPIGTSYRTLERRRIVSEAERKALASELARIAKTLKNFNVLEGKHVRN